MPRTKLLIDCDPGHDDAVAILYAARHCDVLGITTVHGNNSVENVTRNALSVLALAGLGIPVAAGCAGPLVGGKGQAADVHGKGGLEGADLPAPDRAPVGEHAVDFIIETARRHEGELVLAVIGPATNAAVRFSRPVQSLRNPEWSQTPAIAPGWSICVSSAHTPPTVMAATSPWTFQLAEPGPNRPGSPGGRLRSSSLAPNCARTRDAIWWRTPVIAREIGAQAPPGQRPPYSVRTSRTACASHAGRATACCRAPGPGGNRSTRPRPSNAISRPKANRPPGRGASTSRLSAWVNRSGSTGSHQISSPAR